MRKSAHPAARHQAHLRPLDAVVHEGLGDSLCTLEGECVAAPGVAEGLGTAGVAADLDDPPHAADLGGDLRGEVAPIGGESA